MADIENAIIEAKEAIANLKVTHSDKIIDLAGDIIIAEALGKVASSLTGVMQAVNILASNVLSLKK